MFGYIRGFSINAPTLASAFSLSFGISKPQILIVPFVIPQSPHIIFIVVVFPAPFGPRKPKISPSCKVNETLLTATLFPNALVTLDTSSTTFKIFSPFSF